jgi:hypothetical protein
MKRFNMTIIVALLSACFGAGALAQDNSAATAAGKTQIKPGNTEAQQSKPQPATEPMDANAQRAHSRKNRSTPATGAKTKAAPVAAGEVRNWKAIDKNHDNLISPEEMEASLIAGRSPTNKTIQ